MSDLKTEKEMAVTLPPDNWKNDITVTAYRTMQTRLVVSVETNNSLEALKYAGCDQDFDRSNEEFISDLTPMFDHLSPHDESLLAEALLRRLITWESESSDRHPIVVPLLEKMMEEAKKSKDKNNLT